MQKRSDDRLVAYLDGELEPVDRREVEAWLDSDSAARDQLAALANRQSWCVAPSTRSFTSRCQNG